MAYGYPPERDDTSVNGTHGEGTDIESTRAFRAFAARPAISPRLAERLYRLRPDRLILAGGSLVAAAAVVVAFMTAGNTGTPGQGAAPHATAPACVTPAPGR